jgi:uncharacterized damage-inducible protein DinB
MRDDRKPERFEAGEIETQLRFIEYLCDSMARKLEGLTEEQVRRQLVPSGTTLLWLAKHVAAAQVLWLPHFFSGELSREELVDEDELAAETTASVTAMLAATTRRTREIVEARPDPEALSALDVPGHGRVTLRWLLAHLVEEIARHAGHADILRELTDRGTGR